MAYTLTIKLGLGTGKTGLTDLRAVLYDTVGNVVAGPISSGYLEIGSGDYIWTYTSFPDGYRGAVKFYSNASPSIVLASTEINPQETENLDVKISTRSTLTAQGVWDALTSNLATIGSIGKRLSDNIDMALSLIPTAAEIWSYAGVRSLTQALPAQTATGFDLADAVAGGLRPSQTVTWSRGEGVREDLTGATLTGKIRSNTDGAVRAIAGALVVIDGPNGQFRWDYATGDVVEGEYTVQFVASFGSSPTPAKTVEASWRVHRGL